MSFASQFKEFAMQGNVVDLAVGVVIGAAFGKIVASLVENVVMPVVGLVTGGVNVSAPAAAAPQPPRQAVLLEEIRNLLAKR